MLALLPNLTVSCDVHVIVAVGMRPLWQRGTHRASLAQYTRVTPFPETTHGALTLAMPDPVRGDAKAVTHLGHMRPCRFSQASYLWTLDDVRALLHQHGTCTMHASVQGPCLGCARPAYHGS